MSRCVDEDLVIYSNIKYVKYLSNSNPSTQNYYGELSISGMMTFKLELWYSYIIIMILLNFDNFIHVYNET